MWFPNLVWPIGALLLGSWARERANCAEALHFGQWHYYDVFSSWKSLLLVYHAVPTSEVPFHGVHNQKSANTAAFIGQGVLESSDAMSKALLYLAATMFDELLYVLETIQLSNHCQRFFACGCRICSVQLSRKAPTYQNAITAVACRALQSTFKKARSAHSESDHQALE